MILTGIIVYIVLLLIEFGAVKFIKMQIFQFIKRNYPYQNPNTMDDDVIVEKERIDKMQKNELQKEPMVMQNVSKFYGSFCAVNQFSVAVKR